MRALLLVDHGSRKAEANQVLQAVQVQLEATLGSDVLVAHAHMELAAPSIADAVEALCQAGASSIYVMPWFLAPGRHAQEDIPRLCREAVGTRSVALTVGEPMGADPLLVELALTRFRAA